MKYHSIPNTRGLYFISDDCRVWKRKLKFILHEFTQVKEVMRSGYRTVHIPLETGCRQIYIHHLALEVIKKQPRPEGAVCRHLNGDPLDNRPTNLCWGTQQENMDDAKRQGRTKHTEATKERLRELHTGKTLTPEHRQKLSDYMTGRKWTPKRWEAYWKRYPSKLSTMQDAPPDAK